MKYFCFTVDDNIRFLKELCVGNFRSLFDHPYPAMLRRLHERFNVRIQLNLFYRMEGFSLSQMSDRFAAEWKENAEWLKLSFHSLLENTEPYRESDYAEVYADCCGTHEQILRFAAPQSLAQTTTLHYCLATDEGLLAMTDNGVRGLSGLFGDSEHPRSSYGICEADAERIRKGEILTLKGMAYDSIDMVINRYPLEKLLPSLIPLLNRQWIHVMIHEQYFYEDYRAYQPDFEEKLVIVLQALTDAGYESRFFEDLL
ncbi:MAG: hypothetical protein E7620_02675 [Ruminococcaceae bacterium]|nr:hypothetical protein [Oscillospiraceae bacterium]